MRVFNLAEELEKERKKNKELEERIKELKADYGNKAQVERDLLQIRIDKAKRYIKEHSTTLDYKTMKADYNLNMNDLLDILKGR